MWNAVSFSFIEIVLLEARSLFKKSDLNVLQNKMTV